LAAASGGSASRALAEAEGHLSEDREAALAVIAAAQAGRVDARLRAAAALSSHGSKRRDREALGSRLAIMASLLRDLTVLSSGAATGLANADLTDALRRVVPAFDTRRLDAGFDTLVQARDALERNASPKIVADWIAVHL
jgi:DNA polymerase-3 subunit delta'